LVVASAFLASVAGSQSGVLLGAGPAPAFAAVTAGPIVAWNALEAQLPPNAGAAPLVFLGGVACPADGSCVATGDYTDTSGNQQGLLEKLSAGTWTAAEAPLPSNAGSNPRSSLSAPACPADGSCVATGDYTDTVGNVRSTIETLAAGSWSAQEIPLPGDAGANPGSSIGAPACPGVGACVAMADYTDTSGNVQTAIETLSGGTWTADEAPLPADEAASGHQRNILGPVACPAIGSCVAVGSFAPTSGTFQGFIETLSLGTWTATEAPMPANAPATDGFARLDTVTCPSVGGCVAVGWYYDTSGSYHEVMETQSAVTWTPVEQQVPAHPAAKNPTNTDEGIGNVSCPTTGACVAVGSYFDNSRRDKSTIATLAGGTWAVIKAPLPTAANENLASNLVAVTCSPAGACVAVGSAGGDPLIETLPGGESPPNVSSADQATFTVGQSGSMTISATGTPLPHITKRGRLPKGLHFSAGTGTATISGTPLGAPGSFPVTIVAQNGVFPTASQFLTLTITA